MLQRANHWYGGLTVCIALIGAACAGGDSRQCSVNADCVSGLCLADGTCQADGADAGPGGPDADPTQPDGGQATCQPNHDGVLARDEISLVPGRTATFRVATDTPVDTKGTGAGTSRAWDFSGSMAGDADVTVTLTSLTGTWYETLFPGATYATRLSQSADLIGVFEVTSSALLLRGVVSPEAGITRTELLYDPAVEVLIFPLADTATWTTDTTITGLAQGVTTFYTERYESRVDATGDVDTPYGTFPVQRVRVELTRTVGVAVVTSRTFMFVAECFGTVATAVSDDYESTVEFTRASEVRRIAP